VHEAAELLNDSYRMLLAYYPPIKSHALHVYESVIATMPQCALLATINSDTTPAARLLSARGGDWSSTLRVVECGSSVDWAAFSPDGTQIASAGWTDRTVKLWNARTGEPLAVLHVRGPVVCAAFAPDGDRIVLGFMKGTVQLWDAKTYKQHAVIHADPRNPDPKVPPYGGYSPKMVHCVAFSPTGSLIAYGFASCQTDRSLCLWDLVAGTQTFLPVAQDGQVLTVAFSPDGSTLASGSTWHSKPDDSTLASGSTCIPKSPGKLRVWDVRTRTQLAVLEGHQSTIRSVSFSFDGAQLVSGADDMSVRIWDTQTHNIACVFEGHSGPVISVAFSSDGQHVVSGSMDNTVRVWDTQSTKQLAVLHGHLKDVKSVTFSPDRARVASAAADGSIRIWDMRTRPQSEIRTTIDQTDNIVISHNGALLVTTASNHGRVWDIQTYKQIATFEGDISRKPAAPRDRMSAVAFSPDDTRIVSGSYNHNVRVWDARSGQQLAAFECHARVSAVAFSTDGMRIVCGSYEDTVQLWDMEVSGQVTVFTAPENSPQRQQQRRSGVSAVAFSPNSLHIVSGSFDSNIRVWDAVTTAQIRVLEAHGGLVTSVVFSSDGNLHTLDLTGLELAWDFQHIVTVVQHCSTPHKVARAASCTNTNLTDNARSDRRNGLPDALGRGATIINKGGDWLYCTKGGDSTNLVPLCWLPMEHRGRALFRGWIAFVGGKGGNLTMLDFTDVIERLQNLGVI
jgi:WD40 repeat protein